MADNTVQGGTDNIATDERTIGGVSAVKVQREVAIGNTAIVAAQVSVAITATSIVAARDTRGSVVLSNIGPNPVYVGPSGVTAANGFLLPVGSALTLVAVAAVFGIAVGGTSVVHVLETYDS